MNTTVQSDLNFCWEQAREFDPWFGMHFVFASGQYKKQVLPLFALYAMLERTLTRSEESLGAAQLSWWQSELSPDRRPVSAHPAIRSLNACCDSDPITGDQVNRLMAQAMIRLRAEPINDESALKTLCNSIGEAFVIPAVSPAAPSTIQSALCGRCAGTGLTRLMQTAAVQRPAVLWFLPLTMQARHSCGTDVMTAGSEARAAVAQSLSRLASEWYSEQIEALAQAYESNRDSRPALRHQIAVVLSEARRIGRNMSALEKGSMAPQMRWRLGDFLSVWFDCRRMIRKFGSSDE